MWVPAAGYRQWACGGCGVLCLADALTVCPHCGTSRGTGSHAAPVVAAVRRQQPRSRPRAARKAGTR
jgi:hypothetical protein